MQLPRPPPPWTPDAITDAESFSTTLGIPTWLFWGIGVPWLVADVLTTWFCFFAMKDDDLGEAPEEAESHDASGTEGAS